MPRPELVVDDAAAKDRASLVASIRILEARAAHGRTVTISSELARTIAGFLRRLSAGKARS